jgi:hypothetical protein
MTHSDKQWAFPNSWYFLCFMVATGLCLGTGLLLLVRETRDFTRYYLLQWHVVIGFLDIVFAGLSLQAYVFAARGRRPLVWPLPLALILALPMLEVPYKLVFFTGLAAWAVLTVRADRRFWAPTLIFTVLASTGVYLSGPMVFGITYAQTLRSNFFYWAHLAGTGAYVLWMPFAMRAVRRRRAEANPETMKIMRVAVLVLLAGAPLVWGAMNAFKENKRLQYPPRMLQGGYEFTIKSDARLRQPISDPEPFIQDSESCGDPRCHPDIYEQWRVSSHRMAAMTPPYRKILEEFAARFGWEATTFCTNCHNPLASVYGIVDRPGDPVADRLRKEGISCQYCHAVAHTSPEAGNGNARGRFMPAHPPPLVDERPQDRDTSWRYTVWDLTRHRRDYFKSAIPRSEWCGSCHRVVMPHRFTQGNDMILGDTYTPWKLLYEKTGLSCTDCHMPLTMHSSAVHARPDHRMWGINQAMGRLAPPGLAPAGDIAAFEKGTAQWLQGKLPVPRFEVWYLRLTLHNKYQAYREFLDKPGTVLISVKIEFPAGRESAKAVVTLKNNTLVHNFPSSPLDLMESWVEVTARDAGGKVVFRNCPVDGPQAPFGDCAVLGGVPVDADGAPVEKHHFWDARGVQNKTIIPPGGKLSFTYNIPTPAGPARPVTVTARCMYRRYNQHINTWVYGPDAPSFPVTELSRATADIK